MRFKKIWHLRNGLDVEDEEPVVKRGDCALRLFAEFSCGSEFEISSDKEISKRVVLDRSCVLGVMCCSGCWSDKAMTFG
jgi:hypothetical protein